VTDYINLDECWECPCGNYIEDGMHCPDCGKQPPWGCPCEQCQSPNKDEPNYIKCTGNNVFSEDEYKNQMRVLEDMKREEIEEDEHGR
jgi:hypothetical protein